MSGATFTTATTGPPDSQGNTGAVGPQGSAGSQGSTGPSGPRGPQSTSGQVSDDIDNFVLTSLLGQANGVATLDGSGKVPASQLPVGGGARPGTLVTVKFEFAFDTPGLASGIDTGIVLPEGAYMPHEASTLSVPIAWNGTNPSLEAAFTQGDLSSNSIVSVGLTQADDPTYGGNSYITAPGSIWPSPGPVVIRGGPAHIWISVNDGSGGDPGGTVGTAVLYVTYTNPVP